MKLTKGQLTGAFAVAVAGLGTLFANYEPEIDHEPVKLSARAEAEALHHQPLSLLRMAGGGSTQETEMPQTESGSPSLDAGLENLSVLKAFGGTLLKEALKPDLSASERLLMMLEATNQGSFETAAEIVGMAPDELARTIRTTALEDIETLRKEIAVNSDDPLGNIIQLVAIRNGLLLAGLQPDGKILKTYGEQMAGITDEEVHATIQGLKAKATPIAMKVAEYNGTIDFRQMTPHELTRTITVADLVISAYKANDASTEDSGGTFVTLADGFAKSIQAQMAAAKQEQFNRYETMVVKKLQQQAPIAAAAQPLEIQSPFAPPKKGG